MKAKDIKHPETILIENYAGTNVVWYPVLFTISMTNRVLWYLVSSRQLSIQEKKLAFNFLRKEGHLAFSYANELPDVKDVVFDWWETHQNIQDLPNGKYMMNQLRDSLDTILKEE
jgi:hypothetical protein